MTVSVSFAFTVPAACDGRRLDRVLADCRESPMGLRGWRRACETGRVCVNARIAPASLKVRAGQLITFRPDDDGRNAAPDVPPLRLICQSDDLAAVYKPSGLHSARLAGSDAPSAEALLAATPLLVTAGPADSDFTPCLLNRLDGLTSGLLIVARSMRGREQWADDERSGRIDKGYLALVEGIVSRPLHLRQALDTADRVRTRTLSHDHPDPQRHTLAVPLGTLEPSQAAPLFPCAEVRVLTLVLCRIHRGARHQIRAHLAGAGHPLCGDTLYGSQTFGPTVGQALLHHARLAMPGFSASCNPPWLSALPPELAEKALTVCSQPCFTI